MATETYATGLRQRDLLPVDGELPPGLSGCFLQAHSLHSDSGMLTGPQFFSGIRLGAGRARPYRAKLPVDRAHPLAPVPALAPSLWRARPAKDEPGITAFARPVREAGSSLWHTVATYPGLDHAEYLVAGADGTVVHGRPLALAGAPLFHAVALTRRYLVVFDSPVVYSRAAALMGTWPPYVSRPDRPARIGFLPRWERGCETPLWLDAGLGCLVDPVNAYDDGDDVVVDVASRRWRFDPVTGRVCSVAEGAAGIIDPRVSARPHRYVFGSSDGTAVVRRDLATGSERSTPVEAGWRIDPPVFAPAGRCEGEGWLLAIARHAGKALCELRVIDTRGGALRPVAAVQLPATPPSNGRAAWTATRL